MRIDHLALSITAGVACASCNAVLPVLTQSAPALLATSDALGNDLGRRSSANSFASSAPERCRPVETVMTSRGETVPSYGLACQQPDGSWIVAASSDPVRVAEAIEGRPPPRARLAAYGPGHYGYDDPMCTMGRPGFGGFYGVGFGRFYGARHSFHHRARR
jgi:hypothetical protein